MSELSTARERALALDAVDPLAPYRERFVNDDPEMIYLDGNSLGRLPLATVERLARVVCEEWGHGLVRSWADWVDLPARCRSNWTPPTRTSRSGARTST